jgi:hypothetical protein
MKTNQVKISVSKIFNTAKLLIALVGISTATFAAPPTTPAGLNTAQITCSGQVINDSDTLQQLSKQCKDFKAGKNKAAMYDENSKKTVICQVSNNKIETNTCQVKQ